MPKQMVSHEGKGHVTPHFDCLDLRNAMVPLTIPLASHDLNACASDVIWPKHHIGHPFDFLDL